LGDSNQSLTLVFTKKAKISLTWRLTERVVKVVEQAIAPDARVEHNFFLSELANFSTRRQCDVVVWVGKLLRQTITIIEVQDRSDKVDINTFDSWHEKLKRVGDGNTGGALQPRPPLLPEFWSSAQSCCF
jgi:hypothetical protein